LLAYPVPPRRVIRTGLQQCLQDHPGRDGHPDRLHAAHHITIAPYEEQGLPEVLVRVVVEDSGGRVTIDDGAIAKDAEAEWDGATVTTRVVKSEAARRYTLHVAYPAGRADKHVAADGYKDFASAGAVEDAAWSFLTKSPRIGLGHRPGTEGAGVCAESYVYRGPDWKLVARDGSEQVIKAGDWLIGVIWDKDVWPKVLSGEIGGVSMQGSAVRRKPAPEALAALRS
jgi:hypothetical protein